MRLLHLSAFASIFACVILLSSCGDANPPAQPGQSPGQTSAPSAPGQPEAAAPQTGANPRFFATQNYLDQGGSFYLYIDLKDGLRDLVQLIRTEAQTAGVPQVVPYLDIADTILNRLGLYGLQDIGVSVMPEANGRHLNKFFLSAPDGRQGFLALVGGDPHPFETLAIAPADAAFFVASDFDAPGFLTLFRQIATDAAGPAAAQQIDQTFAMLQMQSGLNLQAIIDSFDGHFAMIGSLDPARRLNIPNIDPNTALESPLLLLAIRVKDATLYDSIRTLLAAQGGQTQAETTEGTLRQFNIAVPPNPFWQVQPVIAMDGNYFYAATDAAYLRQALATRGQPNLSTNPEFVEIARGLPVEGNAISFASIRVAQFAEKMVASVHNTAANTPYRHYPGQGEPDPMAIQRLMMRLQGPPAAAFSIQVNQPDGILSITRSNQGGKQIAAAMTAVPVAVLAAIAVPNFLEAQTRSKVSRVRSDHRSLATGIESYFIDNNAYPAWSADPAINAFGHRATAFPFLQSQPTFRTDTAAGGPFSLTTPIAYMTSFFNDPFTDSDATFSYWAPPQGSAWILWSPGPDQIYDITMENIEQLYNPAATPHISPALVDKTYDPTNGTNSTGDVWRSKM